MRILLRRGGPIPPKSTGKVTTVEPSRLSSGKGCSDPPVSRDAVMSEGLEMVQLGDPDVGNATGMVGSNSTLGAIN